MARIELVESGLIYRNPKPHLVSRHAYFPSLAILPDRSVVAGFDIGSAFEAIDVRSYCARSTDNGKTWSAPRPVFRPDESRHPVSTSCRLAHVGDGQLVGLALLMDRFRTDEGLANPKTDGFCRTEFAIVRSSDGGESWSKPEPLAPPIDWAAFEVCSPIVVTPSGRWLAPTAPWPDWSGNEPFGPKAIAFASDDRGHTWHAALDVMNRRAERIAFYEQKLAVLSDKRLLAVCWAVDLNARRNLPNYFALSSDDGAGFSPPTPIPLPGETCTPLALPDQHVLCVYRRVDDKRGLWAHLGRIEGTRWRAIADAPLWGVNVQAHDTHQDSLLAQMSTLRFGCPAVARLPDGDVLVAFWCVEDAVSNIRTLRLRVRP